MNEEIRVMQIKNILRAYYIVNDSNSFDIRSRDNTISADEALEGLLKVLMTEEEYHTFMDCSEFKGEHWNEMVRDYLEVKESNEEEYKEKERIAAKEVAAKEGLLDVTEIFEHWSDGVCSWLVYGTMHDLDPETYQDGKGLMVVKVTNGKITLVDGQ